MGWLFSYEWESAKDVRESLNRERSLPRIAQAATNLGRHLWTVYELPDGKRFINLDLIERQGGEWGYKDFDESEGPFYHDCPLKLLNVAGETTNETAARWRDNVRKQAAAKRKTFRVGDRFIMCGKQYTVVAEPSGGKRTYVIQRADGAVFSFPPRQFAKAKLIEDDLPF